MIKEEPDDSTMMLVSPKGPPSIPSIPGLTMTTRICEAKDEKSSDTCSDLNANSDLTPSLQSGMNLAEPFGHVSSSSHHSEPSTCEFYFYF